MGKSILYPTRNEAVNEVLRYSLKKYGMTFSETNPKGTPVLFDERTFYEGLARIIGHAIQKSGSSVRPDQDECDHVQNSISGFYEGLLSPEEKKKTLEHLSTNCKGCIEDLILEIGLRKVGKDRGILPK